MDKYPAYKQDFSDPSLSLNILQKQHTGAPSENSEGKAPIELSSFGAVLTNLS